MKKHTYPAHQIQAVIDRMAIDEVVGRFIDLHRCGANLVGCCCFHEDRNPSLYVSIAKGIFKCFPCGVGGNAIHFIMEHEGLSWIEAVKWIADFYSLPMEEIPASPEEEARAAARREALGKLSEACIAYQSLLSATPAVMDYLVKDRGLSADIIEQFQLGYGGDKDYFRGRVIFPVHDKQGKCVGFGGRVLPASVGASSGDASYVPVVPVNPNAKYLNSTESDIYKKSNLLYGLHLAKGAITRAKVGYLVEGYTDVLAMHQAGYTHCVGTCGTALTTAQVRLLKPYTKKVVVLFDGDKAGQKAAVRAIDILLEGDMVVEVVRLPKGVDPAEWLASATSNLKDLHEDFVSYILGCVPEGADVPMRVAGQKRVIQAIAKIKDKLYRQGYIEDFCHRCGLTVQDVSDEVDKLVQAAASSRSRASARGASADGSSSDDSSDDSSDKNKPFTMPYQGTYPIKLDIPVDKTWYDYWCGLDHEMRSIWSTVKKMVALETDIVCTVVLDLVLCEAEEGGSSASSSSSSSAAAAAADDDNDNDDNIQAPTLEIPLLNEILAHLVDEAELSTDGVKLLMKIRAEMAIYSEAGQRYGGKTDRGRLLKEIIKNYEALIVRKDEIRQTMSLKKTCKNPNR